MSDSAHEAAQPLESLGLPGGSPTLPVAPELGVGGPVGPEPRSQWQLFRSRFLKHRLAVASAVILILLIVACFGAPWIAPYPKNQQNPKNKKARSFWPRALNGWSDRD